ncbi:MAG: DUF2127 domain-containing protein [Candidatus Aquicultorales bacterium]
MRSFTEFIKFETRRFVGFIRRECSKESGAHGLFVIYILFRRFLNAVFYVALGAGITILVRMNLETLAKTLFGGGAEGALGKWLTATLGSSANGRWFAELVNRRVIDTYGKTLIEYASTISGGFIALTVGVLVFYGLMSLVIALGLYYRRRWAEYVIVAASFIYIPIEIYGIIVYRSLSIVAALVFNVFVIAYFSKKKGLFRGYFSFHPDKHRATRKKGGDEAARDSLLKTG